ncbi:GDP-L-galactose phosphorylase 1-like isoform X4 [Asparagus officinalis]|uniref:GDP-L-galactose phosphorylase 1-like isoform X4 n=1 Tax=Asparagus officinalis TaxID=4686 RepID=UPI00098E2933|nr:GDP-L-galactose phosphorylase 1-like isoform X4 [Asparagus officinalis]
MVSFKQLDGEYLLVKSNIGSEQSKCHQMPPRGIKTHLYLIGNSTEGNCVSADEGLLDALLLSEWEDCSWKGLLKYDVTMCETKIIGGEKELLAQLNDKWNSSFPAEFEKNTLQPLGPGKPTHMKILRENLLFCIASGEKESCQSQLIPSAAIPMDGFLILVNVNPVEYGHIFLVPYGTKRRPEFLHKEMFYLISRFAKEISNCSLKVFFEHSSSTTPDYAYFQAAYFANPLPVELLPVITVYDCKDNKGVTISELADYPLKTLLFTSQNLESLVGLVAEICSILQKDNNVVFNLLVSDCATKVFLFPQVHLPAAGSHLSTWECGGYFIYNKRSEFDSASEAELSERLAAASLDDQGFHALKQLCCSVAVKIAP